MPKEIVIDITKLESSAREKILLNDALIEQYKKCKQDVVGGKEDLNTCAILIVKQSDSLKIEADIQGDLRIVTKVMTDILISTIKNSNMPDVLKHIFFTCLSVEFLKETEYYSKDDEK